MASYTTRVRFNTSHKIFFLFFWAFSKVMVVKCSIKLRHGTRKTRMKSYGIRAAASISTAKADVSFISQLRNPN